MAGSALLSGLDQSGLRTRLIHAARDEKPSHSADLRNETRGQASHAAVESVIAARAGLSRNDTSPREPLWNGPQLNAAFVAQVIGQVLESPSLRPAPLAYRPTRPAAMARVFDAVA